MTDLISDVRKKNKQIDDFFIWAIIGVILGGRIGYVFFYQIENVLVQL